MDTILKCTVWDCWFLIPHLGTINRQHTGWDLEEREMCSDSSVWNEAPYSLCSQTVGGLCRTGLKAGVNSDSLSMRPARSQSPVTYLSCQIKIWHHPNVKDKMQFLSRWSCIVETLPNFHHRGELWRWYLGHMTCNYWSECFVAFFF